MISNISQFIQQLPHQLWWSALILSSCIIGEIGLRFFKKYVKRRFPLIDGTQSHESSTEYYRRSQIIDLLRATLFVGGGFGILLLNNPSAFNFAIVAAGALIITFKEIILSFGAFFYILTVFKVGDTLSIGSIQGEIIYIRPLYVGILGKDENGENTGQLFLLPNNTFITQIVKKEELRLTGYKLERLSVRYNIGCMNIDFETFIRELGKYLDNQLPLRNMSQVGNFRSYAGYRYKIAYTSDKDGIICEISYVSRPVKRSKIQEDIFIFLHAFYEGRKWH